MTGYPFSYLLLTNALVLASAAGTSAETIKAGQILLTDRNLNAIAAGTAAVDLATIHVVEGRGDGQPYASVGIPTDRLVGPVIYNKYAPYVPQRYRITADSLQMNAEGMTHLTLRFIRTDAFTTGVVGQQGMSTAAVTGTDTAARKKLLALLQKRIAKQHGPNGLFTARLENSDAELVVEGLAPSYLEVGSLMTPSFEVFALYDHISNVGVTDKIQSETELSAGSGLGVQVAQEEQAQVPQDDRFSMIPKGFEGTANKLGKYNMYGFVFDSQFLGDFNRPTGYRCQINVAFATTDGTPSAQETAFRDAIKLALPKAHNLADADTSELLETGDEEATV